MLRCGLPRALGFWLLNVSYMAHPGPLMLQPFDRLSALFSLVLRRWSSFQAQRLLALWSSTRWCGQSPSGCLPFGSLLTEVQCQSAIRHRLMAGRPAAASARFSVVASHHTRHPAVMAFGRHCLAFSQIHSQFEALHSSVKQAGRWPAGSCVLARSIRIRQNLCNSSQGSSGMPRSNIYQQGKVCLFSSAVPSRHSLTFRSMGRLHHCSLRQGHAGAPYLGR